MEHKLHATLEEMDEQWRNYSLPIRSLGNSGTYYVVAVREARAIMKDQVVKLDSVMGADADNRCASCFSLQSLHFCCFIFLSRTCLGHAIASHIWNHDLGMLRRQWSGVIRFSTCWSCSKFGGKRKEISFVLDPSLHRVMCLRI